MSKANDKKWYLARRDNPQLQKPYYKVCGRITKADKAKIENTAYGDMTLTPYDTKEELMTEINRLISEGYKVNNHTYCIGVSESEYQGGAA